MEKIKIVIEKSIEDLIEDNLTYLDYCDNTYKPIVLTTTQDDILRTIEDYNKVIIKKHRAVGVSTIIDAIIACRLISNDAWNIICVDSNHFSMSTDIKNIKRYIDILIKKYDIDVNVIVRSKEIKLSNGNSVLFVNNIIETCSYANNWTIFNEAAFNKNSINIFNDINSYYNIEKITIISTQNGIDDLFFPIYFLGKKAGFTPINARWQTTEYFERKKINEYRNILGKQCFEREFGDKFTIDSYDTIDCIKLVNNIKNLMLKGETFSILDLDELIKIIKE